MRRSWTVANFLAATLLAAIVSANEEFPIRVVYANVAEETSSTHIIPRKCPRIDPTDRTIHLPHEWDCTKFYKCDHGKRVLFQCPFMDSKGNRLHFNPVLEVCDWPKHAGCIDGSSPATIDATTEGDARSTQSTTNRIPNSPDVSTVSSSEHTTTESSHTSVETSASPTNAPATAKSTTDISTDATTVKITWPDTTIGSSSISSGDISTISSTDNITPVSTDGGDQSSKATPSIDYVAYENNCSLFYEVINGVKIVRKCPQGLHFSPTSLTCTWPEYAGCELTTVPAETTTPANPACGLPCGDIGHGSLVPHECLCEKYYRCSNGDLILQQCPNGLHFNPKIFSCDIPNFAGCSETTTEFTTQKSTTSMDIPSQCPADNTGHTVQFPHPTNCSLFYRCDNGEKQLLQCPNGLYFNPNVEMCDWPDSAGCTATSTPESSSEAVTTSTTPNLDTSTEDYSQENTGSTATNIVPTECPSENSGPTIQLPDPYNCSLYYTCDNGQKVSQSCSPGLEFNPRKQVCDWPGSSGCTANTLSSEASKKPTRPSGSTTEEGTIRTTTIVLPAECSNDNSGEALHLPYPYNCSLYYRCDNGQKVLEFCPPGLEFNARKQVCDWPGSAGCVVSTTEIPLSTWKWTSIEPSKSSASPPNTSPEGSTRLPKTTIRWITTSKSSSTDSTNPIAANTSPEDSTRLPETTIRWITTSKSSSTDSTNPTAAYTSPEGSTRLPETTIIWTTTPKLSSTDSTISTVPNISSEGSTRLPETTIIWTTIPESSSTASTNSTTTNTSSEGSTRLPETTTRLTTTAKSTSTDSTNLTTPNTSSEGSTRLPETTIRLTTTPKSSSTDSTISTAPDTSSEGSTRLPETTIRLTTTPKSSSTDSTISTTPNNSSEGSTILPKTTISPTTAPKSSSTDSTISTAPNTSSEGSTRLPQTTIIWTTTQKSSTEDLTSSTASNPASECPLDANGLQIPHETNCSLYYECEGGEKILKECTPGLQFSPVLGLCVWPANAGCESTTFSRDASSTINDDNEGEKSSSSSKTLDPSTAGRSDTPTSELSNCIGTCPSVDLPNHSVLLPNENCAKFCECKNSQVYVHDCPTNLHFNPTTHVCEDPKTAKCVGDAGYRRPKD